MWPQYCGCLKTAVEFLVPGSLAADLTTVRPSSVCWKLTLIRGPSIVSSSRHSDITFWSLANARISSWSEAQRLGRSSLGPQSTQKPVFSQSSVSQTCVYEKKNQINYEHNSANTWFPEHLKNIISKSMNLWFFKLTYWEHVCKTKIVNVCWLGGGGGGGSDSVLGHCWFFPCIQHWQIITS